MRSNDDRSTLLDFWGDTPTIKPSIVEKVAVRRKRLGQQEEATGPVIRKIGTAKQLCQRRRLENERWRAGVGHGGHAEWTTRLICGRLSDVSRRFEVCGFKPTCLAFDGVGALLAVGGTEELRVFETDGDFCEIVKICSRLVSGIAWSPSDDAELAVCSRQGSQVCVYDLLDAAEATARDATRSRPKRTLSGDGALAGNMNVEYAESRGEELILALAFPVLGKGRIRAFADTTLRWEIEIGAHPVDLLCLLENGTRSIVVAADTHRLHLWDAAQYKVRDFSNEKRPHCRWSRHVSAIFAGAVSIDAIRKTCREDLFVVSVVCLRSSGSSTSSSVYLVDTHTRVLSVFEMPGPPMLRCAPFCTNALAGTCAVACLRCDQDDGCSLVVSRLRQTATIGTSASGIGSVPQDAT